MLRPDSVYSEINLWSLTTSKHIYAGISAFSDGSATGRTAINLNHLSHLLPRMFFMNKLDPSILLFFYTWSRSLLLGGYYCCQFLL
mmetsp:Transcript_12562/g.29676  ORF Transcript_12562/g.29676 Transcript_12562/m.29676 type:complete len:86 (-) Transcript_12562:1190-1447(-)